MNSKRTIIIHDLQGVGYSNHTLTKGSPIRGSYIVKDGTESVMGVAFRKREQLSSILFPEGLLSIGDASFSHCKALKKVTIPASVEHIGVAAFCKSGLEEVTFLDAPKVIDHKAFYGCDKLKRIIVPKGKKQYFIDHLGKEWSTVIVEGYREEKLGLEETSTEEQELQGIEELYDDEIDESPEEESNLDETKISEQEPYSKPDVPLEEESAEELNEEHEGQLYSNSLVGRKVIHSKFGIGIIQNVDEKYLYISFAGTVKKFLPDAFERGYLTLI